MREGMTGFPSIDKPWLKYYEEGKSDIDVPKCSVYEFIRKSSLSFNDDIAIEYLSRKISYKKLFEYVETTAKALKAYGVKEGDIVSVCLPNIPEVVYLAYAINRIGAVANLLDVRCGENALEIALKDAKSELLICLDSVQEKFLNIHKRTMIKHMIAVSPIESLPSPIKNILIMLKKELRIQLLPGFINWRKFVESGNTYTGLLDVEFVENKDAYIAYTGGTTGIPKGVIATNENIIASCLLHLDFGHAVGHGDRCLSIAPPWTYYGLCNSLNNILCAGITGILIPKFDNSEFVNLLIKHKPNYVVAVPSALGHMIKDERLKNQNLGFLKQLVVGADKLYESLEEKTNLFLKRHDCKCVVSKGYGMTEVMASATCTKKRADDIGSVGIPCLGVVVSVFEEVDGHYIERKIGEKGEICIFAPTIMKGYFGPSSDETKEVIKAHDDGKKWAHTGDIGYIGEDGRLYVEGRIKRMFTRNGYKIFPATVERCILKHSEVEQAAVVGVKNEENGFITKAVVVLKKDHLHGKESIKTDLSKFTAQELYDYEIPDIFEFVDELPLTGMGKVDYRKLEEV